MEQDVLIGNILAYIAGFLIVLSFLFLIIKMVRLKSFKELSYLFLFVQCMVCVAYMIYGIFLDLVPIYVMNIVILLELICTCILKKIYDKRRSNKNDIENQNSHKNKSTNVINAGHK